MGDADDDEDDEDEDDELELLPQPGSMMSSFVSRNSLSSSINLGRILPCHTLTTALVTGCMMHTYGNVSMA